MISTLEPTRYEIAARHPDGRAFLVGYTPRLSRSGLLSASRNVGDALVSLLGKDADEPPKAGTKPRPWMAIGSWRIEFTGRTQRDAVRSGDALPFVKSAT